jgi:hypothetical protein
VTLEAIVDGWIASFALLLSRWEQGLKGPMMGLILVPLYNRYFLVRLCQTIKTRIEGEGALYTTDSSASVQRRGQINSGSAEKCPESSGREWRYSLKYHQIFVQQSAPHWRFIPLSCPGRFCAVNQCNGHTAKPNPEQAHES